MLKETLKTPTLERIVSGVFFQIGWSVVTL